MCYNGHYEEVIMNKKIMDECVLLSDEIIKNIELNEIPFESIILKCLRVCRLMNDEVGIKLFSYEAYGYPYNENTGNLEECAWPILKLTGRYYVEKDKYGDVKKYGKTQTVAELNASIDILKARMESARDPNTSISSSNHAQYVRPISNRSERLGIVQDISHLTRTLEKIKGAIYDYILKLNTRLKFENNISNILEENEVDVNERLCDLDSTIVNKIKSINDNINSDNPEDWSNALTSCRRILKDVADKLYPPREPIIKGDKKIKLGEDNVINRLIAFIEDNQESKTYNKIVGDNLDYLGNRLDAIYNATSKGVHSDLTHFEAKRYVVYTYFILGDILHFM